MVCINSYQFVLLWCYCYFDLGYWGFVVVVPCVFLGMFNLLFTPECSVPSLELA